MDMKTALARAPETFATIIFTAQTTSLRIFGFTLLRH
jgi:hypothetical protein